jgi:hypothetical protein
MADREGISNSCSNKVLALSQTSSDIDRGEGNKFGVIFGYISCTQGTPAMVY